MSLLSTRSLVMRACAPRLLGSSFSRAPLRLTHSRPFTRSALVAKDVDADGKDTLPGKAGNIIESMLYGSKKIKEEEEQTYSKKLARGKYVHELQKHKVKPKYVEDYIKLISVHYPRIASDPENQVNLCGSWQTEIGDQDSFIHVWEYRGYPGHKQTMTRLREDEVRMKGGQEALLKSRLPKKKKTSLSKTTILPCCGTTALPKFHPRATPDACLAREPDVPRVLVLGHLAAAGHQWHLRIEELLVEEVGNGVIGGRIVIACMMRDLPRWLFALQPGNLLEWELNWRKGLECRSQFCEPVGAWFSQLGPLNFVHHMWNYPDLQVRKETREQAWQVNGWAETVPPDQHHEHGDPFPVAV
ncbi:hypothetical protein BC938DRAFT_475882 [Jimgerdemannia flammicorona]|uniref:NIPSNAP domain-containing protein n=1 Tax=Jimgerdemannia flammicorona TaxID=994334 RepID=A0A433QZ75_9FUNG|nr:hypothetical protein BC938DRAFT_475882 [Jimgerdemannia flammicorona]